MCNECIAYIPAYMAGCLNMELNVPREKFHGLYQYPPLELSVVEATEEDEID